MTCGEPSALRGGRASSRISNARPQCARSHHSEWKTLGPAWPLSQCFSTVMPTWSSRYGSPTSASQIPSPKARDQQPFRSQDPVHLEQPTAPPVDVREDRRRPHQVQVTVCKGQGRIRTVPEAGQRGAQVGCHPVHAGTVDVAAPQLPALRFVEEVAEHAPGPTAEVERALTVKGPVRREQVLRCARRAAPSRR